MLPQSYGDEPYGDELFSLREVEGREIKENCAAGITWGLMGFKASPCPNCCHPTQICIQILTLLLVIQAVEAARQQGHNHAALQGFFDPSCKRMRVEGKVIKPKPRYLELKRVFQETFQWFNSMLPYKNCLIYECL